VFPQGSIETNVLLFPMPIEFELDYEISFTIVARPRLQFLMAFTFHKMCATNVD
jgi:hypothetical protein